MYILAISKNKKRFNIDDQIIDINDFFDLRYNNTYKNYSY